MELYGIKKKKQVIFHDSNDGDYDYCNVRYRFNEIEKVGIRKITAKEFKDVFDDDIEDDFESLSPEDQKVRIINYLIDSWIYDEEHIVFVKVIDEIQDVAFFDKKSVEEYIERNDIEASVFEFKTDN